MTAPEQTVCPECGRPLKRGAREGLCAACLLGGLLTPPEAEPDIIPSMPDTVGPYLVKAEVARGGMGIVYRAEDPILGREVALKMLATAAFAAPETVRRFRQEAEAIALLDHPNIIPVIGAGEYGGLPYLVMKFADGGALSSRRMPMENRDAAKLILAVAKAIQFAHSRGVLHRDLKPANVLLDSHGIPMVCDFGLARLAETPSHTLDGTQLGTPAYMAPELVNGGSRTATTLIDVYGLGGLLYYLLTGQDPIEGRDAMDTLRRVLVEDPHHPRVWNSKADRDLSVIALKCLSKEPSQRYRSAAAVADDLAHWLAGEPITARPGGVVRRFAKWVRRRPVAALAAGMGAAAFMVILGIIIFGRIRIEEERNIAIAARGRAMDSEAAMRENAYAADMMLASRAIQDGHLRSAREALERHRPKAGEKDIRGFEWYAFYRDCEGDPARILSQHTMAVGSLSVRPDTGELITGGRDGNLFVWDAKEGAALPKPLLPKFPEAGLELPIFFKQTAASPDAAEILALNPGRFDDLRMRWRPSKLGDVLSMAWSPDGRKFATSGSGAYVRIWDSASWRMDWYFPRYPVPKLEFTKDGQLLVITSRNTADETGAVRVLDCTTRRCIHEFLRVRDTFALLPDGERVALGIPGGGIKIARLRDGAVLSTFGEGEDTRSLAVWGGILAQVRVDGGGINLWDIENGRRLSQRLVPGDMVRSIAFSPNGQKLVAVGTSQSLAIYDARTLSELQRLFGSEDELLSVAFVTDTLVASGCNDGTARVWDLSAIPPRDRMRSLPGSAVDIASRGGEFLLQEAPGRVKCVSRDGMTMQRTPPDAVRQALRFAADQRTFFTSYVDANRDLYIERWPSSGGGVISRAKIGGIPANSIVVGISADGRFGMLRDKSSGMLQFEVIGSGGTIERNPERFTGEMITSRDSRWAFGRSWPRDGILYSLPQKQAVWKGRISQGIASDIVFSPDGELMLSSGDDNAITVRKVPSMQILAELRAHKADVRSIAFSPDGKTLASVSDDGTLRLWHTGLWRELGVLRKGAFTRVVFAGDPARLMVESGQGSWLEIQGSAAGETPREQ